MSTKPPLPTVAKSTISGAWLGALQALVAKGHPEGAPLIVTFDDFDEEGFPREQPSVRKRLDEALAALGGVSVSINSAMIFPLDNLRNIEFREGRQVDAAELGEYYQDFVYPRLRERNKGLNGKGTYFLRIVAHGKPPADRDARGINQLEGVIRLWKENPRLKQSTLQIAIRDPSQDLNGNARRPFPCLQQIGLGYDSQGLSITGFYPTQSILDRAYGNYLGLSHIGWFIARSVGRPLVRVTCMVANPALGTLETSKGKVRDLFGNLFET